MNANMTYAINPRVYFTINSKEQVLIPYRGTNAVLDKMFKTDSVRKANKDQYNEYTKRFLSTCEQTEVYWSEEYSYDPDTISFNFANLTICSNDDFEKIFEPSTFDPSKKYTVEVSGPAKVNILSMIKRNYPCPTIEESGFYVEQKNWNFLVRNILKHINTILIGPTGTGKTEVIMKICAQLNIPCRVYDMGSMQDPLTDLLGSHRLENGSSIFDYAKFVSDVQEPGVIILDELSRAPLMTNNILFPCLDNRRTLPLEIADSKSAREVKIHPECCFIATANIGSDYTGTNDIDAALLNRFMPLQLDYMPANIESKVLQVRTGVHAEVADKIVNFVNKVRSEYNSGNITKSVSTRETLAIAEMVVDGFSLIESIEFVISNKYMSSNYNNENAFIKKLILGY